MQTTAELRDSVRAKIFEAKELKKITVEFFGTTIEMRQMRLADILKAQSNEDREAGVIGMLVEYAFIPDTDEKVFEISDVDSLKAMPFGADFQRISKAMEELTEVNFLDKKSSSKDVPTST